jgi:hypothetical protein
MSASVITSLALKLGRMTSEHMHHPKFQPTASVKQPAPGYFSIVRNWA